MGDGFQILDIILLAMVAGFVLLRLRSVLGRRTGHEQQPQTKPLADESGDDKVVTLPKRAQRGAAEVAAANEKMIAGPAGAGLTRIQVADRNFNPAEFLAGAKSAYEIIVGAFASGDRASLKRMLSAEVFADFASEIAAREAAKHKQETSLVDIKSAEIVEADLKGRMAEVTVRFVCELINATRDSAGNVVAGNASAVDQVTDVWTFARDARSRDPNWTLVATTAPA